MRGKRLKRDIVLNMVVSFVGALGVMLVIRQAGIMFAPAALGIFLLIRRISETASNLLQLGTSFTLRRYIPTSKDSSTQLLFLVSVLFLSVIGVVLFLSGLLSGLGYWADLIFPGEADPKSLAFWLGILSIGYVINYLASSTLMAYRKVLASNAVSFLNMTVWPLAVMWWWGTLVTVEALVKFQAIAMIILSLIVVGYAIARLSITFSTSFDWQEFKIAFRETCKYGLSRTATPFLVTSFALIGPWLIRGNSEQAGYLIIAFTVLTTARMIIQPVSIVFGVAVSKLMGQKEELILGESISLLFGAVLYSSCFLLAVVFPWLLLLLHLWLGDLSLAQEVYGYALVIVFAMIPFAVFQGLKEPIEMIWKQPRNAYTLIISMSFLFIWFFASRIFISDVKSVLYGYLGAFAIQGIITGIWIRKYLKPIKYYGLTKSVPVFLGVCLLNVAMARLLSHLSMWANVGGAVVAGGISLVVAVVFLYLYQPSPFVLELVQFVLPGMSRFRFGTKKVSA
jgi:O-antigen/teichoic acid export membrane protein